MHVEGLTRENVASHLQKFRLQLKKENKLDDEGNLINALVDAVQVMTVIRCCTWRSMSSVMLYR